MISSEYNGFSKAIKMNDRNTKVDNFLKKQTKWNEEFEALRDIVLSCDLEEEYKWMHPCYTLNGNNVVLIHGFKEYCALLFFKGALMKDPDKILIQQTKNVQARRQIRFRSVSEIIRIKAKLKKYVKEAISIEKKGLKVKLKKTSDYEIPEEFNKRILKSAKLKMAFNSLTPGRQRAYLFYFSQAKQPKTREARIEKYIPKILDGKGLND